MISKPIVAISGSFLTDSTNDYFPGYRRSYVNEDYVDSVVTNGGIPLIIPFTENKAIIKMQMELADVLILSGGHDVDPMNYGEYPRQKLGDISPKRDTFDYLLLKEALKQNKPVLGICRGMQIINTFFNNGTLYQDLSYADKELMKHVQNNTPTLLSHPININKDSWLHEILGTENILVNSFHHQAVKDIATELIPVATAPDGVIEALESVKYSNLIAVQWHPEMLHRSEPIMNRLFKAVIEKAR